MPHCAEQSATCNYCNAFRHLELFAALRKNLAPYGSAVLAGALAGLQRRWPPGSGRTGVQWVDAQRPFGAFIYSTYTEDSYDAIWANYSCISPDTWWFRRDFGKHNCSSAHPRRADTLTQARQVWLQQVSASRCCMLLTRHRYMHTAQVL